MSGTRLLHFSDIHVTSDPATLRFRDFFGKRLVGWANLRLLGRWRRHRDAARIVERFVDDARTQAPSVILFSGDATGLSLSSELEEARRLLAPLAEVADIVGIPGNHDIYVRSDVQSHPFSRYFGVWERSDCPDLAQPGSPYPLVRFAGKHLAIIALQAARPTAPWDSSGRLGQAQIEAFRKAAADTRLDGRAKLLLIHYGPCRADGTPDAFWHGLRDAPALVAEAREAGISLILHGHTHARFILLPQGSVPVACVGSLTDGKYHRAYHIYEHRGNELRVITRRYDPTPDAFVPWPEAPGPSAIPLPAAFGS